MSKMKMSTFFPKDDVIKDSDELDNFEVRVVKCSDMATMYLFKDRGRRVWIPHSLKGEDSDELETGDHGYITIPVWKAILEGLVL